MESKWVLMQNTIEYFDNELEKDENKVYYLFKRVSTKDTLFLYYKSIEKTKDEIEKEELNNEINSLKEELKVAQEAIDYLIEIGGDI